MKGISRTAVLLSLCTPVHAFGPADVDAPQPVTIKGYDGHAMEPHVSRDGKVLFDGTVSEVRQVQGTLSPGKLLWFNMDVEVSADGMTLYATDNRMKLTGGPPATSTFFIAHKTAQGRFERDPASAQIMKNINERGALQYAAAISADELTLYFTRLYVKRKSIGIYAATRTDKHAPFDVAVRIESITEFVEAPTIAPAGCGIYFHRKGEDGIHRVWYAHKTGRESAT